MEDRAHGLRAHLRTDAGAQGPGLEDHAARVRGVGRLIPARGVRAATLALFALALGAAALHARPLIDEGQFLFAGTLVSEGALPYRDFPSSQSPMLAYAYAAAPDALAGSPLLGGRLLAVLFACAGMAAALALAARHGGATACVVTLGTALATLPLLWVSATVRSQSLAAPLALLGVAALSRAGAGVAGAALAPSLLLWSSALRLTYAPLFAAVALWSAWRLARTPARLAALAALVGAQALVAFAPLWLAPRHAWFHLVVGQAGREARFAVPERGVLEDALHTLGSYAPLWLDAWLLAGLALVSVGALAWRAARGWRPRLADPLGDPSSAQATLLAAGLLAWAPHLAFSDGFSSYLATLWWPWLPAVGIAVAQALDARGAGPRLRGALAAALVAAVGANAAFAATAWFGRGDASFASFRRVAREVGALGGPGCTMLTLQSELAVEAGCRLFPGLEYGHFSYDAQAPTPAADEPGFLNLAELRRRVAAHPPELVVVGPNQPSILAGERWDDALWPTLRTQAGLDRYALGFLGAEAAHYRFVTRAQVPSGARRRGWRDTIGFLVYRRQIGR